MEGTITVYHAVRTAVRYHSKLGDAIAGGAGLASIFNPVAIVLGIAIAVVYKLTKKHPILYILAAGVAGVLLAL